tara:strand:+ start:3189 stop:5042 length:1854 start_codon:yes stop_codon:yes gene_type:complete
LDNFFIKLQKNLSLSQKKIIITFFDIILVVLSTYFSFIIRYESFQIYLTDNIYIFLIGVILYLIISTIFRLNQQILRSFNLSNVFFIIKVISIYTLVFFIVTFFINFQNSPRSIPIFIGPILFFFFISSRLFLFYVTNSNISGSSKKTIPILIYGAGASGIYFNETIDSVYKVIGFIDDDFSKIGRRINNLKVYSYININDLVKENNIREIIVAIPRLNISERKIFQKKLNNFSVKINFIALSFNNQKSQNLEFDNIRLYDLIDRDLKVDFDLNKKFYNKTVIITGAGGSIGSELSRQIIMSEPKCLILIDISEINLFNLDNQIKLITNQFNIQSDVKFKLLNLTDELSVKKIFSELDLQYKIDYVFHCAAYKHVSLVQQNKFDAFKNNMLSTMNIANYSDIFAVKKFVLISSDKAVRPEGMMGMTKYLSESYVQKISLISNHTNFSIVRFGNVLGSSGSVLPIFQDQIKNGGPITVTDPSVTRYFMTIEEACYLVIQAAIIAKKSETFLINMGEPIKVIELARRLLRSLGLNEKTDATPNGIEIKITGLKKGEKLHEELLITEKSLKTVNKNLMIADEKDKIDLDLDNFKNLIKNIINSNSENYLEKSLSQLNIKS